MLSLHFENPMNERKWRSFTANKRGYISLWVFGILFILSLFANFISNDKPLILQYNNSYYFPIVKMYPETTFGGDFETEAEYSDPFVIDLIVKSGGWLLWPVIRYSYDTIIQDLNHPFPSPPSTKNWLGTDDTGRDVLARVIYGFRISVLFGLILTIASSIMGIIVGASMGYFGGKIDLFGQRLLEVWSNLPVLYLLIILSSFVTPNFWWLLGIMLVFSWMALVDLVRAEFLRGRNFEYVKAARALGLSNTLIMYRHILPNAMVSTMTFMPFILSGSITTLTSLDFLGFGLPVGSPSLGELLAQGKANLHAPWLGFSAFITLSIMLSLLVFIGEAVRDSLDPRFNQGDI